MKGIFLYYCDKPLITSLWMLAGQSNHQFVSLRLCARVRASLHASDSAHLFIAFKYLITV